MPQTIDELGRAWKSKYPGAYDHVDDAEVGRKVQAKFPGAYDHYTDTPSPPQSPPPSYGEMALDFGKGALKGVASTIYHGGDILRRMTGAERIIDKPEVRAFITPEGGAQKAGFGTEQIGEFFVPAGLVGRAEKVVQGLTAGKRAATALNLLGRAGLEAGAAGGVAGLQTGGDPEAMRQAAATAGVTTGALGVAGEVLPMVAPALKESALAQYKRVVHPTKEGTKFLAKTEVVPGLLERRVAAASMKTLQGKAAAQVQKWGQAISDAWANVPPGTTIELKSLTQGLDDLGKEFTVPTSRGPVAMGEFAEQALANNAKLKSMLADIAEVNPTTGAMEVPVERLRSVKQFFDDIAAKAGRYQGKTLTEHGMVEAQGRVADIARGELGKRFPDIDRINKEFSFWKKAVEVLDESVLRRTGQAKPLGRKLAGAAGAAGGFATGGLSGAIVGKKVMDTLEQLTTSTAWGTVNAVWKDKLADALAKGSTSQVEFWVRKIANSIGGARATSRALERFDAAIQPALKVDVPGKAPMQVYR